MPVLPPTSPDPEDASAKPYFLWWTDATVADLRSALRDHDPVPDIELPPPPIEGIQVDSLTDLRVNKLTCILSRPEPRDLVDLLFLDRAGFPPEDDLPLAVRKDAGMDPGVLAWLLADFPVTALPIMLVPLQPDDLRACRDDLRERLRRRAIP